MSYRQILIQTQYILLASSFFEVLFFSMAVDSFQKCPNYPTARITPFYLTGDGFYKPLHLFERLPWPLGSGVIGITVNRLVPTRCLMCRLGGSCHSTRLRGDRCGIDNRLTKLYSSSVLHGDGFGGKTSRQLFERLPCSLGRSVIGIAVNRLVPTRCLM